EEHDREGMPQVGDTPGDDVISEQDNVPSSHDSDSYVGSDSGVSVEHDNVESVERTDVAPAQIELTDKHTVEQGKDTQCGDGMGESVRAQETSKDTQDLGKDTHETDSGSAQVTRVDKSRKEEEEGEEGEERGEIETKEEEIKLEEEEEEEEEKEEFVLPVEDGHLVPLESETNIQGTSIQSGSGEKDVDTLELLLIELETDEKDSPDVIPTEKDLPKEDVKKFTLSYGLTSTSSNVQQEEEEEEEEKVEEKKEEEQEEEEQEEGDMASSSEKAPLDASVSTLKSSETYSKPPGCRLVSPTVKQMQTTPEVRTPFRLSSSNFVPVCAVESKPPARFTLLSPRVNVQQSSTSVTESTEQTITPPPSAQGSTVSLVGENSSVSLSATTLRSPFTYGKIQPKIHSLSSSVIARGATEAAVKATVGDDIMMKRGSLDIPHKGSGIISSPSHPLYFVLKHSILSSYASVNDASKGSLPLFSLKLGTLHNTNIYSNHLSHTLIVSRRGEAGGLGRRVPSGEIAEAGEIAVHCGSVDEMKAWKRALERTVERNTKKEQRMRIV
ncbi:hypothetical protein ADUPG1_010253, partial [Aduncisulcus paluster]